MGKLIKCPKCKNNSFHIVITRSKDPLVNDDEFYCNECGEELMLPDWVEK